MLMTQRELSEILASLDQFHDIAIGDIVSMQDSNIKWLVIYGITVELMMFSGKHAEICIQFVDTVMYLNREQWVLHNWFRNN